MREVIARANWPALAAGAAIALSPVSIAASQIALGASVALTASVWRRARFPKETWLLIFFLAWTLLAAAVSADPAAAWPQIRKFFVFLIVPVVATVASGGRWTREMLLGLMAGGALSAGWSLVQYARKYAAAAAKGEDFTQAYIADRITGFLSHWMTFGGTVMAAFLIAGALVLFLRPRPWRYAAVAGLVGVALFLGWTRGIWIGCFAGVLYLVWSWRPWLVIVPPLVAVLAVAVMPSPEQDRVLSIFRPRGETDSNNHRVALFRTGVEMVKAHPFTGLGPEQVQRNFDRYAPADIPRPFPQSWWYGHLHNIYMQFSADRGIPAMLAIIGYFLASLLRAARAGRRGPLERAWTSHAIAAYLTALLVTGMFEHNLADSEVLLLALGLAALAGQEGLDKGLEVS